MTTIRIRGRTRDGLIAHVGRNATLMLVVLLMSVAPAVGTPIQSLDLVSIRTGDFDYALTVSLSQGMALAPGSSIELQGLSGVVSASVAPPLAPCFAVGTVSAATVSWIVTAQCPVFDPVPAVLMLDGLHVLSSSSTIALVAYQITAGAAGMVSGTVIGPAIVDEAPTLWLVLLAAIAAFAVDSFMRQRDTREAPVAA